MGTSLSGLTPATTFDGLLKVGDNDPLTSTLKAISTGDGTDTILQLSNSALSIGGDVEIDSSGLNALIVKRDGTELLKSHSSGLNGGFIFNGSLGNIFSLGVKGNDFNIWDGSYLGGGDLRFSILADGKTGIGDQTPTAKLHIKGSGATSATTSLLVENSSGTESLTFRDDGLLQTTGNIEFSGYIGGTNGTYSITPSATTNFQIKSWAKPWYFVKDIGTVMTLDNDGNLGLGNSTDTNTARLHVKGSGNDATTNSLLVENSDGTTMFRIKDSGYVDINPTNSSGGSLQVRGDGTDHLIFANANDNYVGIGGTQSSSSVRAYIKGKGATSATTSLLVQNSGGDDMFNITDDGGATLKSFGASNTLILDTSSGVSGFEMRSSNGQQRFRIQATSSTTRFTPNNSNSAFTFLGSSIYTDAAFDTPTARLHVKGAGNDNTTTSLLVENSDGDDLFSVRDDGKVNVDNDVYVQGAIYGGSNTKLRVGTDLNIASTRAWIQGLGATSATTSLLVQNSTGTNVFKVVDDNTMFYHTHKFRSAGGYLYIEGEGNVDRSLKVGQNFTASSYDGHIFKTYDGAAYSEAMRITGANDQFVGIGETTPSARLHVKGSGTTSATYALKVENNSASTLIDARNDGVIRLAPNSNQSALFNNVKIINGNASFGTFTMPASTRVTIQGQGATSATTSLLVQNSDASDLFKITDNGAINITPNESLTNSLYLDNSANGNANIGLNFRNGYGGAINFYNNGGIKSELLQTSAGEFRINTRSTNDIELRTNNAVRAVIHGGTTDPSMTIKGRGATSATTALLVENSSGTDTLEVRDDGRVVTGKGATTNANGTFNVLHGISNLTTRVFTVSRDSVLRGMDINSGGSTKISDSSGDQSFSHTATAVLEVSSTTQGFLPPRMTGTQRDAIESPASGLIIYNTTTNKAQCYNGTSWNDMF